MRLPVVLPRVIPPAVEFRPISVPITVELPTLPAMLPVAVEVIDEPVILTEETPAVLAAAFEVITPLMVTAPFVVIATLPAIGAVLPAVIVPSETGPVPL